MTLVTSRRSFLKGASLLIAAPAIVRASSLMAIQPVKPLKPDEYNFIVVMDPITGPNSRIYYIDRSGDQIEMHEKPDPRIKRMVMLGVPNQGAGIADKVQNWPLFKMLYGPAGQQLVTESDGLISSLPTPDFEFGVLAGGRGAARGYNPLLPGDNDSTVTVASTRLTGARDFICVPVIHTFLMSDRRAIAATGCFLKHGRCHEDRAPDPIRNDEITVIE